jgi:hypothetical protein
MAAIAVAGVGLMVVCSSSLAAVMMMGGEEETPTTTTTTTTSTGPAAGPTAPVFDNDFELVDGQTVQCASNGPKPQAHASYRYVGANKLRWYGTGAEMASWDAGPAEVIDDCTGLSRGSPWQMGMKP